MQREILLEMLKQNRAKCVSNFTNINEENAGYRLTKQTASVGFIYRHIGETTNLIGQFFGYGTDVDGTTIGQTDTDKTYDLATSQTFFETGYDTLEKIISNTPDEDWMAEIKTAWFGNISRIRVLSIILFHNSHHCGQIASAIIKGKKH